MNYQEKLIRTWIMIYRGRMIMAGTVEWMPTYYEIEQYLKGHRN